jgi:predicted kinase
VLDLPPTRRRTLRSSPQPDPPAEAMTSAGWLEVLGCGTGDRAMTLGSMSAPNHESGRLVVLCGLPGSGKTTLALRMASDRGAIRLCPDEWMTALEVDLWDSAGRARVEALQWQLAQDLIVAGATVVIEWGVWSRAERDLVRERARELGASVELHYLDVPIDELWHRVRDREVPDPPIQRSDLEQWAHVIEAPGPDEIQLYDEPPEG